VEIMPEKLDRCVDKIKGEKGVDSAYAICTASIEESITKQIIEASLQRGCECQKKKIS